MICDLWFSEDVEEKMTHLVNQLTDGGVCRTAPATPGLLIILYLTDSVELGQS